MNGLDHIQTAFQSARAAGRAALMPYLTLGFPSLPASEDIIAAIAASGADLIELGLPFSDPLADGPTIQHSTQIALRQGATLAGCLHICRKLRQRGVQQPFLLMGYYNPLLAFGLERFVAEAAESGADGFIIPDLPPEEAGELEALCRVHGLALVYLLAPTSTQNRIELVARRSSGFIYLVSLAGVTGARQSLPTDLRQFIERVRQASQTLPLAVGFGISTPEQARQVGDLADGVIVGSALIDYVDRSDQPAAAAAQFIASLRAVLEKDR